ncbi:MAG: hypothetical protein ABWZ08_01935 [Pseudoxanthomonas sp.]
MSKSNQKPVSLALCTALVGGLALTASAFAMQPMAQGYMVSAAASAPDDKAADKTAEGKCGVEKADTDKDGKVSREEFGAAHPDKTADFDTMDKNKDGFVDAAEAKAHHEGKCGADKKAGEGKCGEGKCGGSI